MDAGSEHYFGDKGTFAIRYEPYFINGEFQTKLAYCHLIFNGQLIGLMEESCYVSTWIGSIEYELDKLKTKPSILEYPEFNDRTDEEVFALLVKANQLEEEYETAYSHLPVLDNRIWSNCSFTIDETIDAYIIFMIEQNDMLCFIWKALRELSPDQEIDKLYSLEINKQTVIDTMQSALNFLKETYTDI